LKREEASSIKRRELCKNKYKLGSGRSFGLGWVQEMRYEGADKEGLDLKQV
jgi:hypothetical protein